MKRQIIAAVVVAVAVMLGGCEKVDIKLLRLCEEKLKETLLAPSGYKKIRSNYTVHQNPEVVAISMLLGRVGFTAEEQEDIKNKKRIPAIIEFIIEYDSPNQYGTPIRGKWECDYLTVGAGGDVNNYKYLKRLSDD